MISYEQAKNLVMERARVLGKEEVALAGAPGRVAAAEIRSKIPVPPFRNSAVDGYAIRSEDTAGQAGPARLKLRAEQPAGEYFRKRLGPGQTVKVMTGAPVPAGADSVVPVEEAEEKDGVIFIKREFKAGENVREAGEDVKKGQVIITAGTVLRAPHLGLLAACGVSRVKVYRRPKVAVLITGNELCRPGEKLLPGKIYDSNSIILEALLETSPAELVALRQVRDDFKSLTAALRAAKGKADVIITSGGVSVGDYDLVKEAAKKLGAEEVFWKVAQKPAKPLAFYQLKKGKQLAWLFGLPGNPGAVMISFEEYVRPFIKKLSGRQDYWPREVEAVLTVPYRKKRGRLNFVRGRLEQVEGTWRATPAGQQESGIISSLAETDGLALVPAEADFLPEGSKVRVHLVEW
ncbi:MAG: Molybdopterin biosynthesis protein MoeA [Candidatus Saccharicenans subterraneus]|uniref:Molybdopterin molybdenumtransferase n=1 Tax=Candidatus Saccharicenans subterraneus TaxID=2508984 RepID=A0A3E2BKL9_9BACT|nr:MAG: Molybdopterin biosynthesis protein MoeA [Candidatus Saccharicenans subterraneum]